MSNQTPEVDTTTSWKEGFLIETAVVTIITNYDFLPKYRNLVIDARANIQQALVSLFKDIDESDELTIGDILQLRQAIYGLDWCKVVGINGPDEESVKRLQQLRIRQLKAVGPLIAKFSGDHDEFMQIGGTIGMPVQITEMLFIDEKISLDQLLSNWPDIFTLHLNPAYP